MEAAVEEGIAWQIKANRRLRKLSQAALAELIGTSQSGVSRLEDPAYGKYSLDTLTQIANAFDCALAVKFISYSTLAIESENLGPESLIAEPFSNESYIIES